jgi:hypothetical protein
MRRMRSANQTVLAARWEYSKIWTLSISVTGTPLGHLDPEAAKGLPKGEDIVRELVCVEHPLVDRGQQRGLVLRVQPDRQLACPVLDQRVEQDREREQGGVEVVATVSPSPVGELVEVLLENRPAADAEVDLHDTARDMKASHEPGAYAAVVSVWSTNKRSSSSQSMPSTT